VAVAPPPPVSFNPFKRVALELVAERRSGGMPPGDTMPSVSRTRAMVRNPLGLLLDLYERRGPVFSVRILHANNVFVLGPEANHFVLVSGANHFAWRDGGFGDLIPLLGDGLLTVDGDFHRSSRRIMLPAFHRERIAGYRTVMEEEARRALDGRHDGEVLDVYAWARALALRVAMRALFGFDPDAGRGASDAARDFERALSFYGEDYWFQVLRGPRTPYARLIASRRRLDELVYGEIARRRATGQRGEDVLSLLMDTELSDRHVRDQVMTLLFAGHDTTTATIAFLFWELAARLDWDDLDSALDETLRLYPPAWIGPRRALSEFQLHVTGYPPACRSTTARGPRTGCPTSGRTRTSSAPSASWRATARRSRAAPTCRSAQARGSASGCASGSSRSASSRRRSASGSRSSGCPTTRSRSARRRRSDRAADCRCGSVRAVSNGVVGCESSVQ